jgi:pimeloyl-ACP methyl ester carboxylesterase
VVDESRHDVNAWLELLRERGFRRVLLVGHSLGAIKAVYTQAHEPHPLVAGVLAMSPPRLSHRAFLQSRDSGVYFAALSQAEQLVAEGRGDELFLAKFPFPLMITGAGYIDKYGPGERYNITRFVHQLRVPALFTYGSTEVAEGGGPFAGVPETLQKVKCETSTLDVGVVSGGDHFYVGVFDGLAEEIEDWLQQRLRK